MSNTIGRYEILSEITHSETAFVYKCSDPESGQTVALKTIKLELLGDQAEAVVQHTLEEVERANVLNSHNIAQLYGAGDMEGQFCSAMEYVQGNSIATMLARKEGFSIWDLQDIARQTCQGLDHAHVRNVVHYSLEPAKILVTWDGTVKILSFGTSSMGAYTAQVPGKPTEVLHYMPPEQLRGDAVDARSNMFSLGAILYEMVTERKAFQGADGDSVRQQIMEQMPPAPDSINKKIHPTLSEVIMKALAKAPDERYQSGQELVNDLEKCKESATKAAAAKKAATLAKDVAAPAKPKPAAAVSAKPASVAAPVAAPARTVAAKVAAPKVEEKTPQESVVAQAKPSESPSSGEAAQAEEFAEMTVTSGPDEESSAPSDKAAAAAAGWTGSGATATVDSSKKRVLDPSAQFRSSPTKISADGVTRETATMSSAATVEPEVIPSIPVDPMMDESRQDSGKSGLSFSEIDELPPMKEIYIAPPPPPPPAAEPTAVDPVKSAVFRSSAPDKPKVQPRQVAQKAVTEIKKTPPKLFMYSIAGAVGIILLVVVGIAFHIRSENSDDDSSPAQSAASTAAPQSANAAQSSNPAPTAVAPAPSPAQARTVQPETVIAEPARSVSVTPKYNKKKTKTQAPAVVAVIPGQLTINSTPAGASVAVDGRNDPSWVTPFNLAGMAPGQHSVTVSRPGYSSETRTIDVASNSKSFLVVQLAQLTATVAVSSEPAGASVFLDGRDTGKVTPAQIPVDKAGSHTVLVRKQGYLEETTTANLQAGQSFRFAPTLRALGTTDEIKVGGKFKKLFGGGDTAGMGSVSIKTQPKGAQIAVNNRMLDKGSPVEFFLNPGTYVVDITLSGFKSIHRVITVEKSGKAVIDENMQRE
jgi:eukaryotic-like serine/threonine-protein kinase